MHKPKTAAMRTKVNSKENDFPVLVFVNFRELHYKFHILDVPKEISNPEILDSYLPIAKATIHETCTLVAAARVRSYQILIPKDRSYTFFEEYGENAQLKIAFPAGVTNQKLNLKVQVFFSWLNSIYVNLFNIFKHCQLENLMMKCMSVMNSNCKNFN